MIPQEHFISRTLVTHRSALPMTTNTLMTQVASVSVTFGLDPFFPRVPEQGAIVAGAAADGHTHQRLLPPSRPTPLLLESVSLTTELE